MMMDDSALRERYRSVLERLGEAVARAGRTPEEVRLIAVSKLHPAADVACVAAAGQVDFGENYVQEALQKRQELVDQPQCRDIRWHMIGHVQSRKAAQVAGAFALVHTLDSVKLADALEKRAAALDVVQPVLCEINVGEEPQKAGIMADALPGLAEHVLAHCPHLELQGLMCLPPGPTLPACTACARTCGRAPACRCPIFPWVCPATLPRPWPKGPPWCA